MPKARDPNRDKAFEIYKQKKGKIDLVEIASQLNVSAGTVRGWKSKDEWEEKMNGTLRKNTERSKQKSEPQKDAVIKDVEQVTENLDLTDKQRLFCIYYTKCFNATKAYQKAYQTDYETAMAAGSRMLRNVKVKEEIMSLKQNRLNREFLSEEDIFQKYMDIAFADITDFVEFGQEEVQVMAMHEPVEVKDPETGEKKPLMKKVNAVRFRQSSDVDGTIISEVKQGKDGASIKLADRMKALEWLANHMNLATEEQKIRMDVMKARAQLNDDEEIADDGFLAALNGTAAEDWADEEETAGI